MRKRILSMALLGLLATAAPAQRATDALDRGLVAMKTSGGVFCSWRILGEEYYDVKYNIYRDGTKLNSEPLDVSNFLDASGTTSSRYSVEAVVRGVPQEHSKSVTPFAGGSNYLEIKMDHGNLTSTYVPNDACCADVDGDGELEILLKFDNSSDASTGYLPGGYNGEYATVEVYKLDGTKLWWLDFGPNMADFQNNENNIVAYDWDGDGKAEAVLRAADGTTIHMANGQTHVVGDPNKNYRPAGPNGGSFFFMHEGAEYLLYLNGETGEVYQELEYPLKRLEDGETDLNAAWGDGYGHRSTKHFFGAPVLDGRKPSIFLARGIYTQHKMVALDVDPSTHTLTERWRWNCKDSSSPWYGQGYHNYGIADVDWDGRDEIVFGSMVIDDSGKGLSTSGLGHGDAQHCSDFDPYTFGQEIFCCNESRPNNNFRDATTSKIYYRSTGGADDGRAMMGKFVRDIPGAVGVSAKDPNLVGAVAHAAVEGYDKGSFSIADNFRIYWDGDLCEETFNYRSGKNTEGTIISATKGQIALLEGSMTNNDTKGTPSYQGDVFGDWREEVIMRTADNNIRIYTTNVETPWRNYTLWHDFQYRQAMVWQMCGYNQPPHTSYFLGEMEGITMAPPPLTMTGRTEIANGGSINSAYNDKHIIMCEMGDMTVSVANGASPYIFTDNAPTWTQGHDDNDNITTDTYTHRLTGGAFAGVMRLVKQGSGVLVLPNVTQTYTGSTDVWGGTLSFDGTLQSSRLWLNRHTKLVSDGGKFLKGIQADYNATVVPGGEKNVGTIEADSLILNFGSRLLIDLFSDGIASDCVKANVLKIEKKDWKNGPQYSTPVLEFVCTPAEGEERIAEGKYLIGEFGSIEGNLDDLTIGGDLSGLAAEGQDGRQAALTYEGSKLYLDIFTPGETTANIDIDFSNPIADGKVLGSSGEISIQPNGDCPTEINAEGRLVLGKGDHTVSIAEGERAGTKDKVTVSFDLGFGKLVNRHVSFSLKDASGENIASFDFVPYSSELTTDLGVETGDMYHGFNTVIWERMTHFTIELDYAKKIITTTTACAFRGDGDVTTNTHEVAMQNTNPLATFTVGSTYDNAGRRCEFDNLLIETTEGNYSSLLENVNIDFTNPISEDKVVGAKGEMAILPNGDCPTEINAEGRLVLGKGEHTVSIAAGERAGANDKVTVSFDLGFGKLVNRHVSFSLKDENGASIASFDFVPYSSELTTDLGVETGDMYHDFNTVIWERMTHFTIELDYANKVITTTTSCAFRGDGNMTTNTHEVPMENTNPLATFTVGSTYDNAGRRCEFDNLKIITAFGEEAPSAQAVTITGAKGLATYTPSVALDFTNAQSIEAYTATVSGTTVNLTRTNTVAAGEGVLIRSLDGGPVSEDIPVASTAVEPTSGNMFVGVLEEIAQLPTEEGGYTNFILNSNGANGSGFYLANNKTVAAGKAYLRVPTESAGKLSFFSLDGSATGVEGVEAAAAECEKVYYNLNGQRVLNPSKGLYILGGKKVIVK